MDKEELQQKISEYYQKLPDNLKPIFEKMSWLKDLQNISKKYDLNEGQKTLLGTEVMLVFLGIIHPVELEQTLENGLNISKSKIEEILDEVNNVIFKDIRWQLISVFNKNNESLKSDLNKGTFSENINFIMEAGRV